MAISVHPVKEDSEVAESNAKTAPKPATFRWFLSYRMLTASMLCLCFARFSHLPLTCGNVPNFPFFQCPHDECKLGHGNVRAMGHT
jgi:hypothetical protein